MTEIQYIPDYEQRSSQLLPQQFRRAKRVDTFVRLAGRVAQRIEDICFDLLVADNPDNATGELLDVWGRTVGERRKGLNDREYRRFITARIMANIAPDDIESIVAVWELITEPDEVQLFWLRPGAFALVAHHQEPLTASIRRRIRAIMESIIPSGIGVTLIEAGPRRHTYTYDEGPGLDDGEFARIL